MKSNIAKYDVDKLDYECIFNIIKDQWERWALGSGAEKMAIGISGGKDSSVVAALAVKIFGKENVIGVLMP